MEHSDAAPPRLMRPEGSGPAGLSDMLGHAPAVRSAVLALSDTLRHQLELDPATRELIVLHLACRHGAEYEWGRHVPLARSAGLTDREICDVRDRPDDLPLDRRRILRFVDAIDGETMSDDIWLEAAAAMTSRLLIEVTMLTGYYGMMVKAERALRPKLQPQFKGFDAPAGASSTDGLTE